MSFIHLNVASGYSLKYGTTQPHDLVQRAAEFEMPALALTDRDGLITGLHRSSELTAQSTWATQRVASHCWHTAMGDGARSAD
jgi:DNA polymerase III alpha subunit